MLEVGNSLHSGSNAYATNGGDNFSCNLPTSQRPNGDVDDMMSQGSGSAPMSPKTNTGNITSERETIIEELRSILLKLKDSIKTMKSLLSVSPERLFNNDIDQTDEDGCTSLYKAASRGHLLKVINLVVNGADPNKANEDGRRALHIAAEEGHEDIVKFLVDQGADVNAEDDLGQTTLHAVMHKDQCISAVAVGMGHLNIVKYLIEQGSKIDKQDHRGYTPLHIAAAKGHLEIIKYLTDQKCSVKEVDNAGLTPLYLAAKHGHLDTVKYLANGRDDEKVAYSVASRSGHHDIVEFFTDRKLLRLAASSGHLEFVQNLVQRGVDINSCYEKGWTPLDYAIQNNNCEVIDYLLTNGAKANQGKEESPLYMASRLGHLDAVKVLISRGISVNAESHRRQIPLHAAAATGKIQVVKSLIENGSDVNKTDIGGWTPLHAAVQNGHLEVVRYLIWKGAINIKYRGMTTLYIAAQSGHLDIVDLLSNGSDVNGKNDTGRIPLHAASANGYLEIVEKLLNHGSDATKMADNGCTPLHAAVYGGRFSDINGESYSPMPSNVTDASFSLQDFWRKNLDTLPRHIKTAIRCSRESCAAKPKTQFHGGELPATDDWPITSENDAVDSKPGIKSERRNIENCFSILTAIHRAILALAIYFACTPVLVAGNVRWVEPVTLDVGTRGVVPFHLQRPSSSVQFSLHYTIQFGSKGRPFCINGQDYVPGFKDPSQVSRFTTTIINRDTSPCVNVSIDDVDILDGDQYIFMAKWRNSENAVYDTLKKEVVVQRPSGRADCFITLSDSEFPYEVHCWANTGSIPTTLTCYQNDRDLVKVHNITNNGQTTRAIFLLPHTTHFSCCSHDITSTVAAATCNDFEWPPSYSGIPTTEKITSRSRSANRPTDPTPAHEGKSNVGSGACKPFMIPPHLNFIYLFLYLVAFLIVC